jgi:asparagine synthase (glutamine-hydrolysing)
MCGIAGIIKFNSTVRVEEVKNMTDSIRHRGPDGEGCWISSNGKAGLGHRRLSIIDLSDAGAQPMLSADNRFSIVFNGEIYNYIEIKKQLIKEGHAFHTSTDTEVLLTLYSIKGADCLQDLDGMFAFAIWDEKEQTLFCARDRFGEKPFYYHYIQGKLFVFASEIKSLHAYGIPLEFHPHRVGWYFNDKYALNNPKKQNETFYKDIQKLEAGYYATVNNDLTLVKKKYWDIDVNNINFSITLDEAKEQFSSLFHQSIQRRLRSDVPVGTSLSGGLDSSSVVCVIADLLQNTGGSQKTFSARFKNYDKDEGAFIEEVIKGKALQAYYTWPDGEDLFSAFEQFLYHQEEPVGTANQFSQWEVMKLAKKENVTVLLDGQGADEIVTGYKHYFDIYLKELHKSFPNRFQKELDGYVTNINSQYQFTPEQNIQKPLSSKAKELVYPFYAHLVKPFRPVRKNYSGLMDPDYGVQAYNSHYYYYDYNQGLNQGLYNDAKNGKLEDLLRYGDKNSMAHSREVRLPFLSHELVEFVFSLPPWFKIHDGWSKFILRDALKDLLPPKIAWRKDKIGYQTPQERWLNKDRFQDLLQESIKTLEEKNIVNKKRSADEIKNCGWQLINIAGLVKTFSNG